MKPELLTPDGELTVDLLADVVGLVDRTPYDRATLATLAPLELAVVYDWAIREHTAAAGDRVRRRQRPTCLQLAVVPRESDVAVERVALYLVRRGVVDAGVVAEVRAGAWRDVGVGEALSSVSRARGADYEFTASAIASDDLVAERIAWYVEDLFHGDRSARPASASRADVASEAASAIRAGMWRESPESAAVERLIGSAVVPHGVDPETPEGRLLVGSSSAIVASPQEIDS